MKCNLTLLKLDLKEYFGKSLLRYFFNRKNKQNNFSIQNLIKFLSDMGVKKGDSVLIFSSVDNIGASLSDAKKIVDAIIELVGEDGEILMPTYPNLMSFYRYMLSDPIYDRDRSPTGLGIINEMFRRDKRTYRSLNPVRPVSYFGKNHTYFLDQHLDSPIVDGETSPYYKFYQKGKGKVILLGTTNNSLLHLTDTIARDETLRKFQIFFPKYIDFKYKNPVNGEIKNYSAEIHMNGLYGDFKRYSEYIYSFCKSYQHKDFAKSYIKIVNATECVDVAVNEIKKNGLTMYSPEFF